MLSLADPTVAAGLGPPATAEHATGLFAAFPDLAFTIESRAIGDDGLVTAAWIMTGTNHGPLQGLPPSGREARLRGRRSVPSPSA